MPGLSTIVDPNTSGTKRSITNRDVCVQVVSSVNKQVVRGLANLDHKLEYAGVLPKLDQAPLPEEVMDEDGNLATECSDVCAMPPSHCERNRSCSTRCSVCLAYDPGSKQ